MTFFVKTQTETHEFDNTVDGHKRLGSWLENNQEPFTVYFGCTEVDISRNYRAVLMKAWRFLFPSEASPYNPWVSNATHPRFDLNQEGQLGINFYADSMSKTLVKAIIWRLANAYQWCLFPDRKQLTTNVAFTKETWNAISIYMTESILKRPPTLRSDVPAQDLEPVASDPQAQTDAAE